MPRWLSYLMLLPGLLVAVQMAFGWVEKTKESVSLSAMLVLAGIALMGMSQAEKLRSSDRGEEARDAEISFALARMMATGLIAISMVLFSLDVLGHFSEFNANVIFWFSLPFFFILLTIKYYRVWGVVRFLYGSGKVIEGTVLRIDNQVHHLKGTHYQNVYYEYEVPEKGRFSGESVTPYSPLISYEPGQAVQLLYDPSRPQRSLLLNAWHGKGLLSKQEYYKKLTRPDEGE